MSALPPLLGVEQTTDGWLFMTRTTDWPPLHRERTWKIV